MRRMGQENFALKPRRNHGFSGSLSPILGLNEENAATRLANLARDALTQSPAQSRAIKFSIKSIFTLPGQCSASRLFSPASPTASPESEYLSHGCVASRGVCKGAPH